MASEERDISLIVKALTCPLTHELFVNPVLANDGHTYERSAIIKWIKNHHGISPMTQEKITIEDLKSNRIIHQLADRYRSSLASNIGKETIIFSGDGALLNAEQKLNISRLFENDKKWLLIYKATKDGFRAADFHRLCDNRGVTLTFIQTRHRFHKKKHDPIFGGYTTIPWSSQDGSYLDSESFLFLLSDDKVTCFSLRLSDEIAVSHNLHSGPIFGADDIHICDRANENHNSFSKFPSSYQDTHGQGRKTFSNRSHFLVNEIEVYMIVI